MNSNVTQWYLNDVVINDYFQLIRKRDPRVHCFDTFFLNRWKQSGYEGVRRWTKNVNIFSKTKVFFPINIHLNQFSHWILVCVDNVKKQITYYDSLKEGASYKYVFIICNYLKKEHIDKLGRCLNSEQWTLAIGDNPCQTNGRDCGVFVCTFAEYLSRDAEFNFNQNHMTSFRQLIAYELTIKRLVNINTEESDIDETIQSIINNN